MDERPPLTVACCCAAWCGTCRDYRAVFDALAAEFGPAVRCRWVDIEDEAERMGPVDVEDFPTLLLARGDAACFFGPVLPHAATVRHLVQRALDGALPSLRDPEIRALAGRLARA